MSGKGSECQPSSKVRMEAELRLSRSRGKRGIIAAGFAFLILTLLLASPALGQVATGFPTYGSFGGGSFDTVNNANLNVHFEIPIINKASQGMPFSYNLTYDSSVWMLQGSSGNQTWAPTTNTNWGWNTIGSPSTGTLMFQSVPTYCINDEKYYTKYIFGPYIDPKGTSHNIVVQTNTGDAACGVGAITGGTSVARDGSGYTLVVTNTTSSDVYWRSGIYTNIPFGSSVYDTNGNSIYSSSGTFTDTLNLHPLVVSGSGTPSSPIVYKYTGPGGTQYPVTENFTQEIVETNFGCSGIGDYGRNTQINQNLVTSISMPDGTTYTITYEPTNNPVHAGAVTVPPSSSDPAV